MAGSVVAALLAFAVTGAAGAVAQQGATSQLRPASFAHASPESVGFSSARLRRLDHWLEGEVAQRHKSGVVVLIARHGRIVWEKAYGVADIASGAPLRTDAMFRLFSMTKPITSVALLTLYEQGKFQLTDPLSRYIPAFADVRVATGIDSAGHLTLAPPARAITLHDVMRHTAGFAYGGYFEDTAVDKAYQAAGIVYDRLDSLSQLTAKLATMPLLYQPGERWVYSYAHDVQAYLVESLSGMAFDEYCRRTLFAPLGMHDTVFGIPADRRARYPTGYHEGEHGKLEPYTAEQDPYERFTTRPFGGVGLASTAQDYLRFAQMLLNGGELGGVRILGRKTVELMTQDNLPRSTAYWTPGVRYGLGVWVLENPAEAAILGSSGEYGWPGLASTWFGVDPREDLIALVFTQFAPRDVRFDDQFQTLVYQALVR